MCITNSLRLTDKHHMGEEFHKSVQGGGGWTSMVSAFASSSSRNCAICGRGAALSKEASKKEALGEDANVGEDAAWLQMAAPAAQVW